MAFSLTKIFIFKDTFDRSSENIGRADYITMYSKALRYTVFGSRKTVHCSEIVETISYNCRVNARKVLTA